MKYLHDDILAEITARLTDCPISSSRILQGRVEAFTTKRTASDKRYVLNNLNLDMGNKETASSPTSRQRSKSVSDEPTENAQLSRSAVRRAMSIDETAENNNDHVHRRLLTDLILTLNLSFSDHDFGTASSTDFGRQPLKTVVGRINRRLGLLGPVFLSQLWSGIDAVITLSQVSTVYTFLDTEAIPNALLGGSDTCQTLWSFNYFFVNKNAKRIVLFTCLETLGDKRRESLSGLPYSYSFRSGLVQPTGAASHLVSTAASADEDSESVDFDLDPAEAISVPVRSVSVDLE